MRGFFINASELASGAESDCAFEMDTSVIKQLMVGKKLAAMWLVMSEDYASQNSLQLRLVLVFSQSGDKLIRKVHLHAIVQMKSAEKGFGSTFYQVFSEADELNVVGFAFVMQQKSIVVYESGEIRNQYLSKT